MTGIIDCNNFYASCERVFNPALRNVPVIIYGNNDGEVIARSEEATALGIGMTVPIFEVKRLMKLHNIKGFSSNYTLYGDMSKRIKTIIRTFFKNVEDYSIDESFVDCKGLEYRNRFKYIKAARDKITTWSGVPVSIGVAETKTLAKLANRIAKKQYREIGVYIIDNEEKRIAALKSTHINDVWGIGGRITKRLNAKGIYTAFCPHNRQKEITVIKQIDQINRLNGRRYGTLCTPRFYCGLAYETRKFKRVLYHPAK